LEIDLRQALTWTSSNHKALHCLGSVLQIGNEIAILLISLEPGSWDVIAKVSASELDNEVNLLLLCLWHIHFPTCSEHNINCDHEFEFRLRSKSRGFLERSDERRPIN